MNDNIPKAIYILISLDYFIIFLDSYTPIGYFA